MMDIEKVLDGYEHFKTDLGTYILGDAREILKKMPSETFDAVITDPPWGVGFDSYDDLNVFLQLRDELYRVMKPNSWLVFYFTPKQIFQVYPLLERFEYKWLIPYVFFGFSTSRNPFGNQMTYSIVLVFAKGKPRTMWRRADLIQADELPIVEENPKEPQFKPTYTTATLLSMFTKPGDLVLDPFAGYGSIPLVCDLYNRRWIAIEIDKVKYAVAERIVKSRKVMNIKKLKESLKTQ
jgi:site-specific DNA-methyltransferase (adenine-specific)